MLEELIVIGTVGLATAGIGYSWYFQAQRLSKEYGPRFEENLTRTKQAIKSKNYALAKQLFEERNRLFWKSNEKFDGWLIFAKPSVIGSIQKSRALEDALYKSGRLKR